MTFFFCNSELVFDAILDLVSFFVQGAVGRPHLTNKHAAVTIGRGQDSLGHIDPR